MEIQIEDKEKSKKEMKVTISIEEMENFYTDALKEIGEDLEIKGFRKGNAPKEIIEKNITKEKIWHEAAHKAVEKTYPEIIQKNNLFPISQPSIDFLQVVLGNPFIYKATFYVMPTIDLPDYKKIAEKIAIKEKKEIDVNKKEIDDTIERIRESRAIFKEIDEDAKKDNQVVISFTGNIDGEQKIDEKDFKFNLGSNEFTFLKGFEENIYGMKAGEEKLFSIEIEKDAKNKDLAGKKIDFKLSLEAVNEKQLPELTDEFAKSLHNDVLDLNQLKEKIKEGIKSEKKTKNEETIKMKIVDSLIEETKIDIPEILVEQEVQNMKNDIEMQLAQEGISFDDYLSEIGKTEDSLKKEWTKRAEKNVSGAIILHKIAEKEKIDVSDEDIEAEVDNHFSLSGRNKNDENPETLERLRAYIADIKKNQKIFNFLIN